jgi:hypothetical protein
MAPARILACQTQHHCPHIGWHARASAPAGRLSPLPARERAMPAQQRARGDQTRAAQGAWQVAGRRREQGTISGAKLRPRDFATQNVQFVTQDQELEVLDIQTTATANEHSEQRPERDVEEREGHIADPPQTRPPEGATRLLAPFRGAVGPARRRAQARLSVHPVDAADGRAPQTDARRG